MDDVSLVFQLIERGMSNKVIRHDLKQSHIEIHKEIPYNSKNQYRCCTQDEIIENVNMAKFRIL